MRKSNLTKILIAILAFSLLLGAIVGVSATAADEGEVYLENADVERNVQYTSKTYLLYRVLKSDIKEEDQATLCMQIASTDGSIVGKVTPKEDGDYYVFTTQGVPAKELNTREVVTVMSGSKAISPAITWSVEDYLYARLYADGFADETQEGVESIGVNDGFDYARRNIYYDLLKYGAEAQKLLAPDAEDKIGDSAFVFADDALATYGRFDEPTKITLRYDDTKTPAGEKFLGWEYAMYDSFGDLIKTGIAADKSVIAAEGYVKAKPVYESDYYTHSYLDFEDTTEIPSQVLSAIAKNPEGNPNGTASIVDGKFALTQDVANIGNNYWYVNPTTKLDGANAVVFEADFSANIPSGDAYWTIYTGATSGTKIYWANLVISGGYLRIKTEYVCNPSQAGHSVELNTPIKLDGTTYKLRVIYRETEWGEDCLEFYADDVLFHTTNRLYASTYNTNQKGPDATGVGCFTINFGAKATGTMTLDNVAMTQCNLPKFEKLGVDETVIDFDGSFASVNKPTPSNSANYQSETYDAKSGNGYILLAKNYAGSQGGLSIDVPVTYTAENADYAVLSFDYYIEDTVTRFDNQIYASHTTSGGYGNATTPIMATLGAFSAHKGKWIHVELTYEVLATDPDTGSVTKVLTQATVTNGPSLNINADATTGVYKFGSTKFKIFNAANTMEVPKAAELTGFRISLNNYAYGDVRFDNLSLKLIEKPSN